MSKKAPNKLGILAENFAAELLVRKGYKIIGRNFRSKFGEIDIIALKDGCLIFAEVKARRNLNYGFPEESISDKKIWKITKTAEFYSLIHPELPKSLRIEVVALIIRDEKVTDTKIIQVD